MLTFYYTVNTWYLGRAVDCAGSCIRITDGACGPDLLHGQHPHREPKPVAVRHLRADFEAPVDNRGILRREARAAWG